VPKDTGIGDDQVEWDVPRVGLNRLNDLKLVSQTDQNGVVTVPSECKRTVVVAAPVAKAIPHPVNSDERNQDYLEVCGVYHPASGGLLDTEGTQLERPVRYHEFEGLFSSGDGQGHLGIRSVS
jgi:hypothetical protein